MVAFLKLKILSHLFEGFQLGTLITTIFVGVVTALDVYLISTQGVDLKHHIPFLYPGVLLALFFMWRWTINHVQTGDAESMKRQTVLLKTALDHPHYKVRTTRADEGKFE